MQSIKDVDRLKGVQAKAALNTFICNNCGEEVKEIETEIPIGPYQGKKIIGLSGCKCEDIELGKREKQRADRLRLDKMLNHFDAHSLLNKSLERATFENYEPTNQDTAEGKRSALEYANNFTGEGNLLFSGTYGTGKSHLSVAITKELMKQGKTCVFISFPKLLTKIKDTYNNGGPTEDQLMDAMKKVDLLVIDDIGAEQKTTWTTAKLFEIIDDRAGKATIYTTNLSSKELKGWVGERNFSRVLENTTPIRMNGDDYRRKDF